MLLFLTQGLIVTMVVGTIAILAGLENSEVLARIRKIEAGKITWSRSFIARIALYGLLRAPADAERGRHGSYTVTSRSAG